MDENSLNILKNVQLDKLNHVKSKIINIKKKVIEIEGPSNVGKTTVLFNFFNELYKDQTIWLDCSMFHRKQDIFFSIYCKLFFNDINSIELLDLDKKIIKQLSTDSIKDFIDYINSKHKKLKQKDYFLIFDHAYFLNKVDKELILNISLLKDISRNLNFIVIFIDSDTNMPKNIRKDISTKVQFSALKMESIKKLILSSSNFDNASKQFENFLITFLTTYSSNENELNKLRYPSTQYFANYLEEQDKGSFFNNYTEKITNNLVFPIKRKLSNTRNLSHCAKLILISAFLASYNSQSSDKKYFSKQQDKTKKKKLGFIEEKKSINDPKKFTFERFYQIYIALLELNFDKESTMFKVKANFLTNHFLRHFSMLLRYKYILRKSSLRSKSAYSVSFNYVINKFITYQAIHFLSESLDIDLKRFLEKTFE